MDRYCWYRHDPREVLDNCNEISAALRLILGLRPNKPRLCLMENGLCRYRSVQYVQNAEQRAATHIALKEKT